MQNTVAIITSSLFFCLLISSCAVNRTIKNKHLDASIVPADFNPQKHIILMEEMPFDRKGKLNRKMNELLVKYYPGKFEIVATDDLKNAKYAGTSIYKYAVVNSLRGVTRTKESEVHSVNRS